MNGAMEFQLELQKERNKLFEDVDAGILPKRVPINVGLDVAYVIQYAGYEMKESQFDIEKLRKLIEFAATAFTNDTNPIAISRLANLYHILGANNFVMGSNGYIQHPEIVCLHAEEYDDLIKDPYQCIHDTILPRLYRNLNGSPHHAAMTFAKAYKVFYDTMMQIGMSTGQTDAKYGLASKMINVMVAAPFDLIADQFRGFSSINIDIRRCPQKVLDACDAVLPMMIKAGVLPNSSARNKTFIPLHMPPYLKEKDFERFYWPTFKKLVEGLVEKGAGVYLFAEQNWMRYLDYLSELPKGTYMEFEYGDPKIIKEKLGKNHIIGGLYPLTLLSRGTKQECTDKAKELIDILAPGGNYIFSFDKIALNLSDAKPENIKAVTEFVSKYAVY